MACRPLFIECEYISSLVVQPKAHILAYMSIFGQMSRNMWCFKPLLING